MRVLTFVIINVFCLNINFGQSTIEFSIKESITEWSYATQTKSVERKEKNYKRKWKLVLTIVQSETADTIICRSTNHVTRFVVKDDLIFKFGNRSKRIKNEAQTSLLGWLPEDEFSVEHVVINCIYPGRTLKGVNMEVEYDCDKCDNFCKKKQLCTTLKSLRNKWAYWTYDFVANICGDRVQNDVNCIHLTFDWAQNNSAIWGSHGTNRKLRMKRVK